MATRYLSAPQDLGGGYSWVLKEDSPGAGYGVEYLRNGIPVNREQVEQATGADVGMIEYQIAPDMLQVILGTTPEMRGETAPTPTARTARTTGGGSTTPPPPSFQAYFGGQLYTDPQAYADAQRAYVEQLYNTNIGTLGRTYGQMGEQLRRNEEELARSYGQQTSALEEALKRGKFKTAQTFDYIAPSLYQTAETASLAEKQKDYATGQEQLEYERGRALGEIGRQRADIAYYQPLEQQQLEQNRQAQLDAIMSQMLQNQAGKYGYTSQEDIDRAMAYTPQVSAANYQTAYNAPEQTALVGAIASRPNVNVGSARARRVMVGRDASGNPIYDYVYA